MTSSESSEKIKRFIFENIDSVEQLEVFLLLRSFREKRWRPEDVSKELRSNTASVTLRLNSLAAAGFVAKQPDSPGSFSYRPGSAENEEIIELVADEYKVRRHSILELIFSPSKKARQFADAFKLMKDRGKSDG